MNLFWIKRIWQLEDKTISVRMKCQGQVIDKYNKVINVRHCSKLKYYYSNGYEKLTLFEHCKDLVDTLVQSNPFKIYWFRTCPLKQVLYKLIPLKNLLRLKQLVTGLSLYLETWKNLEFSIILTCIVVKFLIWNKNSIQFKKLFCHHHFFFNLKT